MRADQALLYLWLMVIKWTELLVNAQALIGELVILLCFNIILK